MQTQTAERRKLHEIIDNLCEEKAALVMGYIQSMELNEEEPDLTRDEEEGLRIANSELARGEGRSFKEVMKELW